MTAGPLKPKTIEAAINAKGSGWKAAVTAEVDTPLVWLRGSEGERYEYEARSLVYDLGVDLSERLVKVHGRHGFLREALDDEELGAGRGVKRLTHELEVSVVEEDPSVTWETGAMYLRRLVDYHLRGLAAEMDQLPEVFHGSPQSYRTEVGLFSQRRTPIFNDRHHGVLGMFLNRMFLHDYVRRDNFEVKLQTAWEYEITEQARTYFNITWDLDQVVEDWLYNNRAGRPWGGGHVQFQMTF